jgi:cytochrome P450
VGHSRVIREHVQTGELRRETAAMNGVILLNAGHETTANMIALGTVALLENPDAAALPTLLRRLPNLHLAVPLEEIRFRNDMSIYGVHELPVAW